MYFERKRVYTSDLTLNVLEIMYEGELCRIIHEIDLAEDVPSFSTLHCELNLKHPVRSFE